MALGWSAGLPTVTELLLILDRFLDLHYFYKNYQNFIPALI